MTATGPISLTVSPSDERFARFERVEWWDQKRLRDAKVLVAGAGWGVVDSHGGPKAAYYYLRRAMQPVGIFATDEGVNGLALHLVHDLDDRRRHVRRRRRDPGCRHRGLRPSTRAWWRARARRQPRWSGR